MQAWQQMKPYFLVRFFCCKINLFILLVIYEIFNTTFHIPSAERPNFTPDKFERILRDEVVTEERFGAKIDEVVQKIMDFYFADKSK